MEFKKKIIFISLVAIIVVLFYFSLIFSQEPPEIAKKCCVLRQFVEVAGKKCYSAGKTVAAPDWTEANKCLNIPPGVYFDCNLLAQNNIPCYCENSASHWEMFCLLNTIFSVTKIIFTILIAVVSILVLYGAFLIVTSSGEPEKYKKGQNSLIFALIGLVLALLSKILPDLIIYFIRV
jgi:hypothetical protein